MAAAAAATTTALHEAVGVGTHLNAFETLTCVIVMFMPRAVKLVPPGSICTAGDIAGAVFSRMVNPSSPQWLLPATTETALLSHGSVMDSTELPSAAPAITVPLGTNSVSASWYVRPPNATTL